MCLFVDAAQRLEDEAAQGARALPQRVGSQASCGRGAQIDRIERQYREQAELADVVRGNVRRRSGGQRQRVAHFAEFTKILSRFASPYHAAEPPPAACVMCTSRPPVVSLTMTAGIVIVE